MKKGKTFVVSLATIFLIIQTMLPSASLAKSDKKIDAGIQAMMSHVNEQLETNGENYRLGVVEYITSGNNNQAGRTVFFKFVGKKVLDEHFVPGDPRRGGFTDISWINDISEGSTLWYCDGSGLEAAETAAAIRSAMTTWDSQKCATIPLTDLGDFNSDLGVTQWIFGLGGSQSVWADITHAGWQPAEFFDAIVPGGSGFILAVTFTYGFVDSSNNPTDIDHNGLFDVAFREVYYNNTQHWGIDPLQPWGPPPPGDPDPCLQPPVDVETVALHESGHGVSIDHLGKAFIDGGKKGKIHLAPYALMNPVLWSLQQDLEGIDKAAFCSIWARWPNH
jgi:hypothetical protein